MKSDSKSFGQCPAIPFGEGLKELGFVGLQPNRDHHTGASTLVDFYVTCIHLL